MTQSIPKQGLKLIILLIAALMLFAGYSGLFQVGENEAVLLTRFEQPKAQITNPGLHMKWPWPIERIYRFDLRTQIYESPLTEIQTADGKVLVVRAFVLWSIGDPEAFRIRIGLHENARPKLFALLQGELRASLSRTAFSDLFNPAKSCLATVEQTLTQTLQTAAVERFGIRIHSAGLDRLELPARTTQAVFARQKAEYEQQSATILEAAKRKAGEIEENARLERGETLARAETEAAKIRGEADAQALITLDVYRKDPELARFLRTLDAAEKILKTKTTLVLDYSMPLLNDLMPDSPRKLK